MTQPSLYHIGFGKHDLGAAAPTAALLCGDPERAQRIAKETDGVSCLAERLVAESVDLAVKQQAECDAVKVALGAFQGLGRN